MSDVQTVEVDEAVVNEVAAKATEAVQKSIEDKLPSVDSIAEKVAEKLAEKTEKNVKKDIHEGTEKRSLKQGLETLPKEVRFAKAIIAQKSGDHKTLNEYNALSLKAWTEKSNYQNVTTAADGGALVPDPEFIAEIDRLTSEYGVVARLANVRSTDRDSVTLLAGTNEVSFTKTGEATAQNAQKLTYSAATVALDKYIATLVMTSELVEDSAIDIFQDAANEIARARAKLFDQLVFTDATYGLLTPSVGEAYKTLSVGSALSNADADDFMNAKYQVVGSARRNGRYFMHPSVWNQIRQQKASTSGDYLFGSPGQGVTPMIDGVPVELVDILPDTGSIASNKPFAVYGDLGRIMVHVKRLLETKVFDAGVVKDAGGSDINLITQDSWAMRATLRCVPQTRFPGAFVIIGTGTVS